MATPFFFLIDPPTNLQEGSNLESVYTSNVSQFRTKTVYQIESAYPHHLNPESPVSLLHAPAPAEASSAFVGLVLHLVFSARFSWLYAMLLLRLMKVEFLLSVETSEPEDASKGWAC